MVLTSGSSRSDNTEDIRRVGRQPLEPPGIPLSGTPERARICSSEGIQGDAMNAASRFAAVTAFAVALVPPVASADDGPDVTGTWTMTVETAAGSGNPTFTLTQKGEEITGTYSGRFGEAPVTGTIKGNQVTLRFTVSVEGQEMKTEYVGTVEGDAMTGKVVFGGFGEGTFKGTRARPAQP